MGNLSLILEQQAPDDYIVDVIGKAPDFQIGGQTKEWMVIDTLEANYPNEKHRLYYDVDGEPCADIFSGEVIIARISWRNT